MITRTIYTMPANGAATIYDVALNSPTVKVLYVKRENNRLYHSGGTTPLESQYLRDSDSWGLIILNSGAGTDPQKVTVIYKS